MLVYRCPEMDWPSKAFCYAAKAHPELASAPDELLITYAANSWEFWNLFKDARLYWPRFVRVKLSPNYSRMPEPQIRDTAVTRMCNPPSAATPRL